MTISRVGEEKNGHKSTTRIYNKYKNELTLELTFEKKKNNKEAINSLKWKKEEKISFIFFSTKKKSYTRIISSHLAYKYTYI